jgi:hypothetical protein
MELRKALLTKCQQLLAFPAAKIGSSIGWMAESCKYQTQGIRCLCNNFWISSKTDTIGVVKYKNKISDANSAAYLIEIWILSLTLS